MSAVSHFFKRAALTVLSVLAALFLLTQLRYPSALPADSAQEAVEPKYIAITFDDGPKRTTTVRLLDGLRQRGVPATFFLVGELVPGNEDILRRMVLDGHEVGIHSYTHGRLTALNDADFSAEVDRAGVVLSNTVGQETYLLRPPYGDVDPGVLRRAQGPIILWSIDPRDWSDRNTERQVAEILTQAKDGDIILLHDIYESSVETAFQVIDSLQQNGFYFLTVSDLFAAKGIPLEQGQVYRRAGK